MLVSVKEPPSRNTGAGNSSVSYIKQAGQKTSLAEQETPHEVQEGKKKKISLEQSYALKEDYKAMDCLPVDTKSQSSIRVETGQCCVR